MRTPEERARIAGTVLILFLLLVVFSGMLLWMYSVRLVSIPAGIAGLLGIDQDSRDTETSVDANGLSGMIMTDRPVDGDSIGFELNYSNLRKALLDEPELPGYRQELLVRYGQSDSPVSVTLSRSGEKARIEVRETAPDGNNERVQLMIYDTTVYILDDRTGESRSVPRAGSVSPESAAGLPSIAELLSVLESHAPFETDETLPADTGQVEPKPIETGTPDDTDQSVEPLAAAFSEKTDARFGEPELTMTQTEAGNVYFASFSDNYLGTREEYVISLEHNVVLSQSVWHDGELLYSCETVSFSTDPSVWNADGLYNP